MISILIIYPIKSESDLGILPKFSKCLTIITNSTIKYQHRFNVKGLSHFFQLCVRYARNWGKQAVGDAITHAIIIKAGGTASDCSHGSGGAG